jgi:hypothetical protein
MLYKIYATPCNMSKSMLIRTAERHRIETIFFFFCKIYLQENTYTAELESTKIVPV